MKSMAKMSFILGVLSTLIFAQMAQADRVDRRQHRQRARIYEGVKSGELTREEAKKLRAGERHLRRMERRAKADGEVSDKEAARLERTQDRLSDRIYKEKHD